MIEEIVTVTATKGELALVAAQRQSMCGSCDAKSSCGTSVLAKAFGGKGSQFLVANPIGAQPGERVVVGLDEAALPKASFLFYIVPLIALFLGALMGEQFAQQINSTFTEPLAILGGLLGLSAGLIQVRRVASGAADKKQFQAVILRRADTFTVQFGCNYEP